MAKNVIIAGAGMADMSAAQQFVESEFEVDIIKKQSVYAGGKARSVHAPKTNKPNPDKYLPGKYGFRFFHGFTAMW